MHIKKKDIKEYIPEFKKEKESIEDFDELEEMEDIDEFVNSMGAKIDGDKVGTTSQIKVAKGATTDDFETKAIQPGNWMNVSMTQAGRAITPVVDNFNYDLAKNKLIKLLEDMNQQDVSSEKTLTDFNNNAVTDLNELPFVVARKVSDLIETVDKNNLSKKETELILKIINESLNTYIQNNA